MSQTMRQDVTSSLQRCPGLSVNEPGGLRTACSRMREDRSQKCPQIVMCEGRNHRGLGKRLPFQLKLRLRPESRKMKFRPTRGRILDTVGSNPIGSWNRFRGCRSGLEFP